MTRPVRKTSARGSWGRIPLMFLAVLALLGGLWAGLVRIGWQLPPILLRLPAQHGPLMVSGFLGTLISLERAVALSHYQNGRRRYYLAPLLAGLGALALFLSLPPVVPRLLSTAGALGLALIFVIIYRLQPTADHAVMGVGALLWLVGNGLWLLGEPIYRVVPWWAGFLVLTIAAERLELSRVMVLSPGARRLFLAICAVVVAGLLLTLPAVDLGLRLVGTGFLALGLWLWRYDIARRTIRAKGLTRFIAACLLPGYLWLIVGGALWLIHGGQYSAGLIYDAMLHTIFLGFVFSMIFGHAPIILPAVLGVKMVFSPLFYGHLILLHVSVGLRVVGDLLPWLPGRRWGGLLSEVAVLLFIGVTIAAVLRARQPRPFGR